jgi:hypothetical protein
MEAPNAPDSSVVQYLPGSLRTPVARKSVPIGPGSTTPQAQASSSGPSDTLSNKREEAPVQQDSAPPNSKTNPSSTSIEAEIERIREERERLSRLMELDRMEERLRQQLRARDSGVQ